MSNVGNWVGEITTTEGTGDITLGGALPGRTTFASTGESEFYYAIVNGNNREAGIGNVASGVLTRTTVHATLVSGVYEDGGSSPINLVGQSQVYATFNKHAFDLFMATANRVTTGLSDGDVVYWDNDLQAFVPSNEIVLDKATGEILFNQPVATGGAGATFGGAVAFGANFGSGVRVGEYFGAGFVQGYDAAGDVLKNLSLQGIITDIQAGGAVRVRATIEGVRINGTDIAAYPLDVIGDVNITGDYRKNGATVALVTQQEWQDLISRLRVLEEANASG